MKNFFAAAALLLAGAPALATDYFLVVPFKGKVEAVQVALNTAAMPEGLVGSTYSYDFSSNLVVTGDTQFAGAGVAWGVSQGSLPAGLTLDSITGAVRGVPTTAGLAKFSVTATYKAKAGQQNFQLAVAPAKALFALVDGPPRIQALVGDEVAQPSPPNMIGMKNTGLGAGSLMLPAFGGPDAAQFHAETTCANVPVSGSCAVSVTWTPTSSTAPATATLELAGAIFTFNGSMAPFATWDPANTGSGYVLSNNNLSVTNAGSITGGARATVGKSTGKWYWEVTTESGASLAQTIGIAKSTFAMKADKACFGCDTSNSAVQKFRAVYPRSTSQTMWAITAATTTNFAGTTLASTGAAVGDTYGFALDADAQTLTVYYAPVGRGCVNHQIMQWTNIGAATWYPAISTGGGGWSATANFGSYAFKCTAPAGYRILK